MSHLKDHKFIVFGTGHYNPLGICRSLGEAGIAVHAVEIRSSNISLKKCRYVKVHHMVYSMEEGLEYIIKTYGNEQQKPFLLTGSDDTSEYLDINYDRLVDRFYFGNCGGQGKLSYYNQKNVQCNIAQKCGIDIPKSEVLAKGVLPTTLKYPVLTKVTKATSGAWKHDVHVCNSPEELSEAYKSIKADELLVQEFITKKNELCIDGISINGGEEVFLSYTSEYLRFTNDSYGGYMRFFDYQDDEVKEKIKHIIRELHYTGVFCIECLIDKDNHLYFLEVNQRNSGWSYAHTFIGYNLSVMWAKATLENKIDTTGPTPKKEIVACSEVDDSYIQIFEQGISPMKWYKSVKNCDMFFVWNKNDKLPGLIYWFNQLKIYLGRKYITHTL